MRGERIKAARRMAGLSQRALAARLGVSAMAVSKWERGEVLLGSARLLQIADALECPVSRLRPLTRTVTLTRVHYCQLPEWV